MKKKAKYQTVLVTIPNTATPGAVIEQSLKLDQDYSHCTGIAVSIAGTLSTMNYVDVGVRSPYGVEHDPCHIENWQASSGVEPNKKFKDFRIKTDGRLTYAQVIPPSTPAAQVQIQFIFRLEDDLVEVAN